MIRIPFKKPLPEEGVEYFLQVSFRQKKDTRWAGSGFEIAWEQFKLPWEKRAEINTPVLPLISVRDSADHLILDGSQFKYVFNKKTGHLESMFYMGKRLVSKGPVMNVWRAPLANETDEWGSTSSGTAHWGEGYGKMAVTDWYSTGIHDLKSILERFSIASSDDKISVEVKEILITPGQTGSFQNLYRYSIDGTGEMIIEHSVIPGGEMPAWLPRMGTEWILSQDLDQVVWYGRGPQENYPDRKTGYRIGKFSSTVRDMVEPYLIPQDYGLRTDNRWVRMLGKDGAGLEFSGDGLFNFNAFPFTIENLTKSLYTYQLQAFDGITFNFDYATSGVGCTARSVFNQYRVMPTRYDFITKVRPFME